MHCVAFFSSRSPSPWWMAADSFSPPSSPREKMTWGGVSWFASRHGFCIDHWGSLSSLFFWSQRSKVIAINLFFACSKLARGRSRKLHTRDVLGGTGCGGGATTDDDRTQVLYFCPQSRVACNLHTVYVSHVLSTESHVLQVRLRETEKIRTAGQVRNRTKGLITVAITSLARDLSSKCFLIACFEAQETTPNLPCESSC